MRNIDINRIPSEIEEEEEECNNNIEEDEEEEDERSSTHPKKKLRLTKEQSFLLEETFRQNKTLNPKQKEVLAMQLKLKPRQVEVWFQNRRARSKLKQTEVECDYLKKWFNSLTEQNKRLHKEVEELRAIQVISPYTSDLQLPASSTMCPRCERVTTTAVHHHPARANTTVAATTTPAAGINWLKTDKVN